MNGMAGTTSADSEVELVKKYCTRAPAIPMASATATATAKLRNRAAMTAANAATISKVKGPGSKPIVGAASIPASPASDVLTAHTPMETVSGFVPESDVIAGESTMALTRRPIVGVVEDESPDHDDDRPRSCRR